MDQEKKICHSSPTLNNSKKHRIVFLKKWAWALDKNTLTLQVQLL